MESDGLALTPVQVQEELMFQVPGVDNRHGGRGDLRIPLSCGLLIFGKQPTCLRATDSMGRFREIHLSRRGGGRNSLRASL